MELASCFEHYFSCNGVRPGANSGQSPWTLREAVQADVSTAGPMKAFRVSLQDCMKHAQQGEAVQAIQSKLQTQSFPSGTVETTLRDHQRSSSGLGR